MEFNPLLKVFLIVLAKSATMAAPINEDADATVISYEYKLTENGYYFEYTTSNGLIRREQGVYTKEAKSGDDSKSLHVNGSYSYVDDKGKLHIVEYKADENGYVVKEPPLSASGFGVGFPANALPAPQDPKGISSAALASLSG